MRELKAKIWNPAGNNILEDVENVFECLKQQLVYDKAQPSRRTMPYDHKADGMVWLLYTGIKDKNGVEIYFDYIFKTKFGIGTIVWSDDRIGIASGLPGDYHAIDSISKAELEAGEVLGNIYQHRHLFDEIQD